MPPLPDWCSWELEISPHCEERMLQRGLSEIELWQLLDAQGAITAAETTGRWKIGGKILDERWIVVVEPDPVDRVLIVITAYRVSP